MNTEERIAAYKAQRQGGALTPRQQRRIRKKTNHLEAGGIPQGRVRKRFERKELNTWRKRVKDRVEFIRAARAFGGARRLVEAEMERAEREKPDA